MCDNFSVNNKCDYKKECKIMKVMDENLEMKKQIRELKKTLADTRLKMSYMNDPNAISNKNDMGW